MRSSSIFAKEKRLLIISRKIIFEKLRPSYISKEIEIVFYFKKKEGCLPFKK
jgi:hypothetical protein